MLKATAKTTAPALNRRTIGYPGRQISDVFVSKPVKQAHPRPRVSAAMLRQLPQPLVLILVALLLLGFGAGGLAIVRNRHSSSGQAMLAQTEAAIGKHYLLPASEQPVLATVTDATQLKTPFLKQAQNGDQLLIYANAKIVILYRPSVDRIVAVGPVELDASDHSDIQQP